MIDVDVRLNQMDTKLKEVKCSRCGRMMVFQKFYGPHEHFLGWRCIYCGEIVDQLILENRLEQRR